MEDAFARHRLGVTWAPEPDRTESLAGNRFPVEAYDNFARQFVPR